MRLFLQTIKDAFIKAVSFDKKISIKLCKAIPKMVFWTWWFLSFLGLMIMLFLFSVGCLISGDFLGFFIITGLLIIVFRFYVYLLFFVSERFPKLF